ncbi:diguanylate cyclase domain-containing protein [Paenibacillus sp. sgz500958]|uniref:sensor domain-containing diguanylate cyclase n=1 Tax=Paenibacillus sp. sgz500958 TaxID=3242475 RepID=UPI0036D24CA0
MSEQEAYDHKGSQVLEQDTMPASDDSEDPTAWLRETDIVSYDFPYATGLITESFLEWHKGQASLPFTESWKLCVLNYEGKIVANINHDSSWDALWEEAASFSLLSRKMHISHTESQGKFMTLVTVPILTRSQGDVFALLGYFMPTEQFEAGGREVAEALALFYKTCFYRRFEHVFVADIEGVHLRAERESNRHSLLFQIVQRMHDNIDVNAVLIEVIESISAMFPGARLMLYMSQDHRCAHPKVKPLPIRWENGDVCARAFKDGKVTLQASRDDSGIVEIGLPLGGKQGVYGVFHMEMFNPAFPDVDLRFLSMVADTAGTAFENAKLYERSNQLIRELRMSNELTQRLNQSLRLGDIFNCAYEELLEMFEADYCCILHLNEGKGGLEVVACNHQAMQNEIIQTGQGLGGKVFSTGDSMILSEYLEQPETASRLMKVTSSQSLIATPLSVGGEIRGAILLTHRRPHYFSYDNYRLLQAMAGHIGLAVGNARLHAEVRRLANRDSLTGLYARHYLDEEIQVKQGTDFCGSLIVVDIDQFKLVNDTYGHQKGDKILKQVSEVVKTSIRKGDTAARWGGEELAVYLPQLGVKQAAYVAERIRSRVSEETEPRVTVSCGIAEWSWTDSRVSVESLFYRADMALYDAKNNGRNRVVIDNKLSDSKEENP